MAEYESIHGTRVRYLTSDPTLDTSTEGEVWYNSTSGTNKALVQIKAFSSSANTPTNFVFSGGVGGQTDTLGFGGVGPSPQPAHNLTIEYSGFSWTGLPNLNTNRRAGYAFGTSTSAVYAGGDYSPGSPTITLQTEEYNGSSWTAGNNISEQGSFGAASGTLTAGLAYGGYNTAQTASSTRTVSYDGTNWTALPTPGADTNVSGNFTLGGGGTQTAAIFSGGSPYTGSRGTSTETFDGSSWTSQNNMNTGRGAQGLLGTQTNALYAGGIGPSPSRTGATEEWDSSTWTTSSATMSSARNASITSKGGSTTAAVIGAGSTGSNTNATEEYNSNINAITQSAWAAGGALPTGVYFSGGAGDKDAALSIGGSRFSPPAGVNTVNIYNGSTWTGGPNLNYSGRGTGMSGGPKTAAWVGGGAFPSYPTILNNFSTWNDSSWTAGPTLATNTSDSGGTGPQTACLGYGGYVTTPSAGSTNKTQEYNGSSWSNVNNMPVSTSNTGDVGQSQTAAGAAIPGASTFLEYDGTNWSAGGSTPGGNFSSAGGGPLDNCILAADLGIRYNGTAWSTDANLGTPRTSSSGGKMGDGTTGIVFGGAPSSNATLTEEYTQGTSVTTASTLTTS